jgi:hypothetical protein
VAELPWTAESRPCYDPECAGTAEPEQDGDHRYWACAACGFAFGYEKVAQTATVCSAGVPQSPAAEIEPVSLGMPSLRRPS